jgi:hypothetical protein
MDRQNNNRKLTHKLAVCLYTVASFAFPLAVKAEVTNVAGPSASATGNVTNQAVQVLQGPYPVNSYGSGVSCAGPSMAVTPFVLGNNNWDDDPESYAGYNTNAGVSLSFNFPLDGSLSSLCRERVRVEIERIQAEADKARLDFELVRLMKCAEVMQTGFTFHPDSPYAAICSDVITINTYNQIVMGTSETVISQAEGETLSAEGEEPTDRAPGDTP